MNLTIASNLTAIAAVAETNVAFWSATRDGGVVLRLHLLFLCALILAALGCFTQLATALGDAKKRREGAARRASEFCVVAARCGAFWTLVLAAIFVVIANRPRSSQIDWSVPVVYLPFSFDAENEAETNSNVELVADSSAVDARSDETFDVADSADFNERAGFVAEMREVSGNGAATAGWRSPSSVANGVRPATALEPSRKTGAARNAVRSGVVISGENAADSAQNDAARSGLPTGRVYIPNISAKAVETRPASAPTLPTAQVPASASALPVAQVSESASNLSTATANRGKISQPVYREDPRGGAGRSKIAQTCFEPLKPIVPYPNDRKIADASELVGSLTNDGQTADFATVGGAPKRETSILERIDAEFNRISDRVKTSVLPIEARKKSRTASQKIEEETGTGFLTQYLGRVFLITNRHVVADAESREAIRIFLPNKKVISPIKIMTCVDFDLAILELNAADLPRDGSVSLCFFGDSDALRVGNFVGTVGSPFGLENTVTYGRVSSLRRRRLPLNKTPKNSLQEFIQIDASINPGNSGGPLYNSRGEVVGVVTAIASTSGKNEGVAFAIPINLALEVVKATIDAGAWRRSHMGVVLAATTRSDVSATNRPGVFGAKVLKVQDDSPAKQAGLRGGDVVLSFDGQTVEDDAHLARLIATGDAENGATLEILRGLQIIEVKTDLKRGEPTE